jgi:FMN phosphatase YigB (HAD superfamily)
MTTLLKRNFTTILVDLDNTIYDYNRAGQLSRERLTNWVSTHARVAPSVVQEAYSDLVKETAGLIFRSGNDMRRDRFESLARRLNVRFDAERLASSFGDWLLEAVSPYAGAIEALFRLSRCYSVMIVSEGYSDIQGSIARKLGIGSFDLFATFQCSTRKLDGSAYAFLISSRGLATESTVMIGDNWLKDVIAPAKYGIRTICITHGKDIPDETPAGFIGQANELAGALPLLGIREQHPQ